MKIQRSVETLHPILIQSVKKIQKDIIDPFSIPIRLFETGRSSERHEFLLKKGKTRNVLSRHIYDLNNSPPLYASAVDYVYYNNKWSWNLRNSTILAWYHLFGNLVSDVCPELNWFGYNRENINYCHFELKQSVIIQNLNKINCVLL